MCSRCLPTIFRRQSPVWRKCRLRTQKHSRCPRSSSPPASGCPLVVTTGPYRVELQSSVVPIATRTIVPTWKDDIFIGAPLFMDRRKDKKLHEVGQVYLYLQNENNGFSQKPDQILTGWDLYGRFGSAIAPLGDIDQDGYDDIAVGAPFSGGDGRVYIFNGQSDGVDPQYSQVLESPFRRLPSATGFGFALRGGSDVDSNSYPDLIVGAWGPPLVTSGRNPLCDLLDDRPGFKFFFWCPTVLNAELQLDRMKQRMMRRTLFVSSRQSQGHFQLTLGRDKPSVCTNFSAYLRDESEFKDKLSPILVSLSYSLDNSSSTDPEAPPAFLQGQTTAHIQVSGGGLLCVPFLSLFAPSHKESFYIGDEDPVLITVTARNEGEGAYETELHVRPPPQIHYQGVLMNREGFSMPICSQRKENGSAVVVCELRNPMKHDEQVGGVEVCLLVGRLVGLRLLFFFWLSLLIHYELQLHAGLYFSAGNLEQAEGSVVFELQLRR
uniref:Integrin alpha-2 domain-containing protein n=1 Tax=Erpetoichthys calabaricus TaxID=27687 RepID=A0A8C4T1G2_ERPCA